MTMVSLSTYAAIALEDFTTRALTMAYKIPLNAFHAQDYIEWRLGYNIDEYALALQAYCAVYAVLYADTEISAVGL